MARKKPKQLVTGHLTLAARATRTALSVRLTGLELYPGQDAVLLAIGETDGISLSELAARLAVRPPTITKTLARLSAQGLLVKRADPDSPRQSRAHLTDTGRAIVDDVRQAQKDVEKSALKGFSNKERKALRKLLKRLDDNLSVVAMIAK